MQGGVILTMTTYYEVYYKAFWKQHNGLEYE